MSKKSAGRCHSADSISSFGETHATARSSVSPSSTKRGSSANQECTSTSSVVSLNYQNSPRRSTDESDTSSTYLSNLEYLRQKFSSKLPEQEVHSSYLFRPMISFLENDRRNVFFSGMASGVCALHVIEEKDECTTENSAETPENSVKSHDLKNCRTPRFYEVPPKRICLRPRTPEFKSSRYQTEQLRLNLDNLSLMELSSNDSSFFSKTKRASSSSSESNLRVHLPSSVIDEVKAEMPPVEPKIIILNSDRSSKRKTRRKDYGKGDCFSESEETVGILKKYCEFTPEVSPISTPTYTVSPILIDRANQTDSFETCYYRNKIYSQTELDEVEIKTVEPETEKLQFVGDFKDLDERSLQNLKSLIVDFAEGVEVTRKFPDNFQDIEDKKVTSSFKDKGSELLQVALSTPKSCSAKNQLRYDEAEKGRDLIEGRKSQVIDLDYYTVASTSSDEHEEKNRSGLEIEDILLEEDSNVECCGCFRFRWFLALK